MTSRTRQPAPSAPTVEKPFVLYADGRHTSLHATLDEAITFARETLHAESFAVYDEHDSRVFMECPQPVWA